MIQTAPQNQSIRELRLRPGLDALGLETELMFHNRSCDVSNRAMAYYLEDMARRGLYQVLGYSSAVHFARDRMSMSERQGRYLITVGRALQELTLIDQAFADGRISWTKVRLLVAVCTPSNESEWLIRAESIPTRQLEEDIRGVDKGRPPRSDSKGTPSVRFQFSTKLSALDHEVLEQARKKVIREAGIELNDAEVLLSLAQRFLDTPITDSNMTVKSRSRHVVSVNKCPDCAQAHVHTEDGPVNLSASEASAFCCDAEHVGDIKDQPTPEPMRRRVLARDGHRCFHCSSALNPHVHHIKYRSDFGPTVDSNLITMCNRCHGLIHDDFLIVTGTAPHNIVVTDRESRELGEEKMHSGIRLTFAAEEPGTRVPQHRQSFGTRVPKLGTTPRKSGTRVPRANELVTGPKLSDLIGQETVIDALEVACEAAAKEKRPVRHFLLSGPPGLGKTTAARAVAVESGAPFIERIGASIESIEELTVPKGSILFIDEIHALARPLAEQLYAVMDEKRICVIGATTDPDQMPRPLRDRFTMKVEFLSYSVQELAAIVKRASRYTISNVACGLIAKASFGVPRCALAHLAATEDHRIVAGDSQVSVALVHKMLRKRGISSNGLSPRHRQALTTLKHHGKPMGLTRLTNRMGIEASVFSRTIEPELLKLGLVDVTSKGLVAV